MAKPSSPKYPGIPVTCNGNKLVASHVEARITDGGIFYPITPSTEGGELYQDSFAKGELNVFGQQKIAVETEGEHAAQGGATAFAVTGRRTVNFTSGQGIAYAMEQYYHAPGKLCSMVLEVGARALTKHALNVHCGHDDIYSALDTGWSMLYAKDAQQAADQGIILRKVNELTLNPGMNCQDGMLTTHAERAFLKPESDFLREFLGSPHDIIETPTEAQRELFGKQRRRIPRMVNPRHPLLVGPVQNQEHHMNGVIARRNNFSEHILNFLQEAYDEFAELTGREYGFLTEYKTEDADTVFVSIGSAAENIEAACDHLREKENVKVGSIHLNVIRPFPEEAIIKALAGKKNIIVLERTDESLSVDNPIARDIRAVLSKANEAHLHGATRSNNNTSLTALDPAKTPRIIRGSYGIGSRDFRPEHIMGAYEFATGKIARNDGKKITDGETYFTLGIEHPYAVKSEKTPSLLPKGAIAVRFHSIGGWGMITTGKNMGEILSSFGHVISDRNPEYDAQGNFVEKLHIAANPKYGSEKKGSPTNYFLVVAPERIRVNCELNHVDVVLCCDPKAFTHTNPAAGINPGGSLVWESSDDPETAWQRIPKKHRAFIKENKIRVFILPGFDVAKKATSRPDLQLRMQGNSFLGAFFKVSSFLADNDLDEELFKKTVRAQYKTKFGRFGDAVIESNMEVMKGGFRRVQEIKYGEIDDPDTSSMRLDPLAPVTEAEIIPLAGCPSSINRKGLSPKFGEGSGDRPLTHPSDAPEIYPFQTLEKFDSEYRSGLGYHQPAGALSSIGVMAAGTGATASKYVARRETPRYIPENCTQCMECITACPDTALPNTAQDVGTVLTTAAKNYITDEKQREEVIKLLPDLESRVRERMKSAVEAKENPPFPKIIREELTALNGHLDPKAKEEFFAIMDIVPVSFQKVPAIFRSLEKKNPGQGGVFSIFVSDLCKGCGECVEVCGDHNALVMEPDTPEFNQEISSAQIFSRLLPDTPQKYLGLYNDDSPEESRPAALRNHLMVRRNYEALVSGDGACAGCGEKSILRAVASVTEAYMRPIYHKKADRLSSRADRLEKEGASLIAQIQKDSPESYLHLQRIAAHVLLSLGGESIEDTDARIKANGGMKDQDLLSGLISVLRVEAFNHKDLQTLDGRLSNGMSVMMMGASTGCNTVYGSTPPSNPHPYPWMNSLFQDGPTISWLMGESLILSHARRAVVPERIAEFILKQAENPTVLTEKEYFDLTHMTDVIMTDDEIREMPKVWCIGGDGALGDIGFQNLSKAVLQSRPNVKFLMLDTQVYSNTGGQNSDSSPMLGGYDMNQLGDATQGKLIEKKSVAETLTAGHGSPYIAQVSIANAAKLYQSLLEGIQYRGAAFYQCYTTCQPEHGVGDDMSAEQAKLSRDSRGMPEFVFNPRNGETINECYDVKGNPNIKNDWQQVKSAVDKTKTYSFTVAHWAVTEARFRNHLKRVTEEEATKSIPLEKILPLITQEDFAYRRFLDETHRSYVPDFGVVIYTEFHGKVQYYTISRQLVLYCVERRKAWRMLQSRAGVENPDYATQKELIAQLDKGELTREEVLKSEK